MKLKTGIIGDNKTLNNQLYELLLRHSSIEVKALNDASDAAGTSLALPIGLDFVFCTYQPDSGSYLNSIEEAIRAGLPVIAYCGKLSRKCPVLKIDINSGEVTNENVRSRSNSRGICIINTLDNSDQVELLVALAEFAISHSYITQIQSVFYQ